MATVNRGVGLANFGTAPFGFGNVALANPNVGIAYDLGRNTQGTARFINPATRDYQIDPNTGRLLGQNTAQQLVYLALVTELGSSSVIGLGQDYTQIKVVSPDLQAIVNNSVKKALKLLIDNQTILLNDVVIDLVNNKATDPNRAMKVSVKWTDLLDNTSYTTVL